MKKLQKLLKKLDSVTIFLLIALGLYITMIIPNIIKLFT